MPNGDAVANVRGHDRIMERQGTEEITGGICSFYRLAEIVDQYLKKGAQVYVEGRIRTRKWQDKEGQERYTAEIEANEMQMLGGSPGWRLWHRRTGRSAHFVRSAT